MENSSRIEGLIKNRAIDYYNLYNYYMHNSNFNEMYTYLYSTFYIQGWCLVIRHLGESQLRTLVHPNLPLLLFSIITYCRSLKEMGFFIRNSVSELFGKKMQVCPMKE